MTANHAAERFEVTLEGHLAELVDRVEGDHLRLVPTGVPDEAGRATIEW